VYDNWKSQASGSGNVRSYRVENAANSPVPYGVLGGGSDFMVFLQHDGIPSIDMIFDGPYGVYHSLYDDFAWMSRFGDPTFRYHATMARLWGVLTLRFADADIVPFNYSLYPVEIAGYLRELKKIAPKSMRPEIDVLLDQCLKWQSSAANFTAHIEQLSISSAPETDISTAALNSAAISEERALTIENGIPGRPWFRHLVYAPLPSYEADTLP